MLFSSGSVVGAFFFGTFVGILLCFIGSWLYREKYWEDDFLEYNADEVEDE